MKKNKVKCSILKLAFRRTTSKACHINSRLAILKLNIVFLQTESENI